MQFLATTGQMQDFDRRAINAYSLPGIILMENAGRAFVDALEAHAGPLAGRKILVVSGKGNNGGDGFVIARHLANRGALVHVALLCKMKDVRGDAKTNLDILRKMAATKQSGITLKEISGVTQLSALRNADIIVDAIFGTGFSGEVRGWYRDVIDGINTQKAVVASVDIPSGVDASTGIVENIAVKAALTVTMGLLKVGHCVGTGREHSGQVVIADISIPRFLMKHGKAPTMLVECKDVKRVLPQRGPTAHKYTVGKVLVLAGSRNFTGAPVMTSVAAMRMGAGLAVLGTVRSIHQTLAKRLTEVVVQPLEETAEGSIGLGALPDIRKRAEWADVLAIGPGLSLHAETQELVRELLKAVEKPIVLDADGLTSMAGSTSILKKRRHPTILTPHTGELQTLAKLESWEIERNRVPAARAAARQFNSVTCLKGSPTAIGLPDGTVYLNPTGNPGMATGGAGDVLTGVVASLIAQGMEPGEAAYAGVFVHGLAGDIAAKRFGERSLMAMDLLECLPEALNQIETECLNA